MMKHTMVIAALLATAVTFSASAQDNKITITEATEIHMLKGLDATPDNEGFISTLAVELPTFESGCYYRPFSGGGHAGANGNRVSGMAFTSVENLLTHRAKSGPRRGEVNKDLGQFMLLKINDNTYTAIMPLVTKDLMTAFYFEDKKLVLKTGHFGKEIITGDHPTVAYATGKSPYEATHKVYAKALASGFIHTNWRSKKEYPEMYQYLGWCSWENYRTGINEENMIEAVKILETCDVAVRWFMIDDGYLNADNRRLLNFLPNEKKFPNGWHTITELKHPDRIRWMGLWRHMMGYMSGTSAKHTMDIPKEHLIVNGRGNCVVPNGTPEGSMAFYEEMAKQTKAGGFDFTKVDFQSRSLLLCKGLDNPIRAMHYNNMALEEMLRPPLFDRCRPGLVG